jgi:hypothetical protein
MTGPAMLKLVEESRAFETQYQPQRLGDVVAELLNKVEALKQAKYTSAATPIPALLEASLFEDADRIRKEVLAEQWIVENADGVLRLNEVATPVVL